MTPQVSVIIPVFNSMDHVRDAVQSVRDQTIDPETLEIFAVDDGSTGGSGEVLAELAAEDPRMMVITQGVSSTPGGARNAAIDRARGEFIVFLGSDDRLTSDALRRMVETAQEQGVDVVLGKVSSSDAQNVPPSMFTRTVLDAHLVDDNVFDILGPTKLIRRELIDRLGLRFPEEQTIGEDESFMAVVYLNARRISMLADMDYAIIRPREDGNHVTPTERTAESQMMMAVRLARTIEQYTEPGTLRDSLLERPFGWTMERALDSRWTSLDRSEQTRLAETFHDELEHLYTDGVRKIIGNDIRAMLDLLGTRDLDGLHAYIEHLASGAPRRVGWQDGDFVRLLPAELEPLVPPRDRVVRAPKMLCRLEDVSLVGRQLTVSATVRIPDLDGAPDELGLRAKQRGQDGVEDLRVTVQDLAPGARSFAVTAVHGGLVRGIWDLFVVVRFGDREKEIRLGAERARTIPPEGVSNLGDGPRPQDRMLAYFTRGPDNLSIDSGLVMHPNLAAARVLGLTPDENGRALLLVGLTDAPRKADEFFAHLSTPDQHGGRQLLPSIRLGDRLLGLRLPIGAGDIGVTVTVTAVLGDASAPLPVAGTEFWPARATGFGLMRTEGGGLLVTAPSESARHRDPLPEIRVPWTAHRLAGLRGRLVPRIKAMPVVGPSLTRTVRAVRERRS